MTTAETNHPAPVILSDEALAEIEAREPETPYALGQPYVPLTPDERDALCQTVRAAWAERDGLRGRTTELHNRIGERNERIVALQSENAALREQLAEARTENERLASQLKQWQEEKDTKAGYL